MQMEKYTLDAVVSSSLYLVIVRNTLTYFCGYTQVKM